MTTFCIWAATGLYVAQALVFAWQGNGPHALMFGGYALANIGIIWTVP